LAASVERGTGSGNGLLAANPQAGARSRPAAQAYRRDMERTARHRNARQGFTRTSRICPRLSGDDAVLRLAIITFRAKPRPRWRVRLRRPPFRRAADR